jgi:hypothetical protein
MARSEIQTYLEKGKAETNNEEGEAGRAAVVEPDMIHR